MCNRYNLRTNLRKIADAYDAHLVCDVDAQSDFLPRGMVPGVRLVDGERQLAPMQFSFSPPGCPSPSDPKRALNNARIESVGKWPWKDAFRTSRCIVPIYEFREPCYWGPTEGTEVYFHRADCQLLHSAAIYRVWQSPDKATEIVTMALLMRPASDYIMRHGHHRQPLFISAGGFDEWLSDQTLATENALALLREIADEPDFAHTHARDMAESWTKRRKAKLKDRDEQLAALEAAPAVGF